MARERFNKFNHKKPWSFIGWFIIFFVFLFIFVRFLGEPLWAEAVYGSVNFISSQYISRDVLFWSFSTVIQSFVAFVSLLGMVTIYRIQIIRRDIEAVAEAMRGHLMKYKRVSVSYKNEKENSTISFSSSEVYGYTVKKIIKDTKGLTRAYPDDKVLKRAHLEFYNLEKDEYKIKKSAILFLSFVVFLLISSLILLPMSSVLEYTYLGLLLLWLIILWSLESFVLGLNFLIGLI